MPTVLALGGGRGGGALCGGSCSLPSCVSLLKRRDVVAHQKGERLKRARWRGRGRVEVRGVKGVQLGGIWRAFGVRPNFVLLPFLMGHICFGKV